MRDLSPIARAIVAEAPTIDGWSDPSPEAEAWLSRDNELRGRLHIEDRRRRISIHWNAAVLTSDCASSFLG